MIKLRIVIAIFFTLLSSLNLYKLLTEEGYKGGGKDICGINCAVYNHADSFNHFTDRIYDIFDKAKF